MDFGCFSGEFDIEGLVLGGELIVIEANDATPGGAGCVVDGDTLEYMFVGGGAKECGRGG